MVCYISTAVKVYGLDVHGLQSYCNVEYQNSHLFELIYHTFFIFYKPMVLAKHTLHAILLAEPEFGLITTQLNLKIIQLLRSIFGNSIK